MNDKYYSDKFEFGIALSIMALPLGWAYGHITGKSSELIVDLLMVIAFICIVNINSKSFYKMNTIDFVFLAYQSAVLLYIVFSNHNNIFQEIIYNAYTIAIFLFIVQNKNKRFKHLTIYFSVLGTIIILVTFLYATEFFKVWQWNGRFSLGSSGDPLTLSNRILIAVVAIIIWKPSNKWLFFIRYIAVGMGIVGILATGVRKTFLMGLLMFLVNTYYSTHNPKYFNKERLNKFLKSILILAAVITAIYIIMNILPDIFNNLMTQFNKLIDHLIKGIEGYLGMENAEDLSAQTRVELKNFVINRWENEDGIIQFLFGHGYIETYVDIPYIQIFSDLGLVMGSIYCFYSIIFLLINIFQKQNCSDDNIRFLKLLAVPTLVGQFVSGVPYGYRLWLPIVYSIFLTYNINGGSLYEKNHCGTSRKATLL